MLSGPTDVCIGDGWRRQWCPDKCLIIHCLVKKQKHSSGQFLVTCLNTAEKGCMQLAHELALAQQGI